MGTKSSRIVLSLQNRVGGPVPWRATRFTLWDFRRVAADNVKRFSIRCQNDAMGTMLANAVLCSDAAIVKD